MYAPHGPDYGRPRRGLRVDLILVAAVLALVVLFLLLGLARYNLPGNPYDAPWGGLFSLVLVLLIGLFVLRMFLGQILWSGGYRRHRHDPALEIARRRYARGEITREQYQQLLVDLGSRAQPGPSWSLPRGPPPPPP